MRQFIVLMGMVCLSGSSFAQNRPNILFVYADDQRYDAVSVVQAEQGDKGRFPWFKTPNMDRLAKEGVRFRNAFVTSSLCAPSRAVNLTGRYNHLNGIASNFREFPVTNATHASIMRANGYTTAYIGKWHMNSQRARPGFDFHASFLGHARYEDAPFVVDGKDVPTKGWIDDVSTDYAIGFMRQQKGSGKPWSMVVGFKAPHGPCTPPERAKNRFEGELARTTPNLNVPGIYLADEQKETIRKRELEKTTAANVNYFRCVSAEDDCLGKLLDALDETGFATNTIVIYTSDNGYYLGEHGLGDKRSAYEESLRVPFIVRDPTLEASKRGTACDEIVLNLDLAPTLLDYAGLSIPASIQGKSWRPLLSGKSEGWRKAWFYEYFAEKQKNSRVPDITAVRAPHAKMICYVGHPEWTEVFDLKADPYELKNLFNLSEGAELRAYLEGEHAKLIKDVAYCVPDYVDRPDWWGKPGGPDAVEPFTSGFRVGYVAEGYTNKGKNIPALVEGKEGTKAFSFDGTAFIEAGKNPGLSFNCMPFYFDVTLKAECQDGIILARGGQSLGYALWLKDGRLMLTMNTGDRVVTAKAKKAVQGWVTVRCLLTKDKKVSLLVNDQLASQVAVGDFFEKDPNDSLQIGTDTGSPVLAVQVPAFKGLIESVKFYAGEPL